MRLPVQLHRHDPVEHDCTVERPDNVVVRPGLERAAAIVKVVVFQHHRDVRRGGALVRAQAAAHLQPRHVVHHPVDEGPHRPLDQLAWSLGADPGEREAALVVNEIVQRVSQCVGQEDVDHGHRRRIPVRLTNCRRIMTRP